jgi:O-antigen ligase
MNRNSAPPVIVMEPQSASGYRMDPPAPGAARTPLAVWPLAACLLFAPLAFGATEPWALALLQTGAILTFTVWGWEQWRAHALTIRAHPLLLPSALFGAVILAQVLFGLTSYWFASYQELLRYIGYGALLFVATQVTYPETTMRRLAVVFAVFGAGIALLALAQDLTADGLLYWVRRPRFGGEIYGPYVNRNHYAGLMELLTPFPLLLAMHRRFNASQRSLFAAMGVLMAATVVLSGSRAGTAALFAELLFLVGLLIVADRTALSLSGVAVALVAFIGLLYWLDASAAVRHWTLLRADQEASVGRWAITRDAWHMFLQKPLLGFGIGSFPVVYPAYRSFYTDFFINQAHNDVAQVLVETGVLGGAAMIWFVVAMFRSGLQRRRARSFSTDSVHLAALVGCTGLLVHSFFDFNLHIPANAALFFVMAALAAQPREGKR